MKTLLRTFDMDYCSVHSSRAWSWLKSWLKYRLKLGFQAELRLVSSLLPAFQWYCNLPFTSVAISVTYRINFFAKKLESIHQKQQKLGNIFFLMVWIGMKSFNRTVPHRNKKKFFFVKARERYQ